MTEPNRVAYPPVDVAEAKLIVENRYQPGMERAAVALLAEVRRLTAEPNLAAASTRELLEELRARGEAVDRQATNWSDWTDDEVHAVTCWAQQLGHRCPHGRDYRAVGS